MGVEYEDAVLFGVRQVVEGVDPAEYGLFCPVPSATEPDAVALEERDGTQLLRSEFNSLQITTDDAKRPMADIDDIRGSIIVTDARVAFACSKYDKGGSWVSAAGVASKALAAHRRQGKMMVSHVRYPWLAGVYGQNRSGFGGAETLRLVIKLAAATDSTVKVNVRLPKSADAVALASEIVRRAARFRLAHERELDDPRRAEHRSALERFATLPDLKWEKGSKSMAGVSFLRQFPVDSPDGVLLGTNATRLPDVPGRFKGFETV